jgi:hypothetical protein
MNGITYVHVTQGTDQIYMYKVRNLEVISNDETLALAHHEDVLQLSRSPSDFLDVEIKK